MEKKATYLPPRSEVFQLATEGIVAASGESIQWGGNYDDITPAQP